MFVDREVAKEGQPINATFMNWGSASVVNPKVGFHFCDGWFVTSVTRGRPMDIALQPLNPETDSGFRLLMRDPPEQVRIWHRLPGDVFEGRMKFVKVRLRGISQPADALQLDSMALFVGDETSRKVDRRLVGAIALNESWHDFAAELRGSGAVSEGARYLSLRFSGKGTIEVEFCRLEANPGKASGWPTAKSIAAKILSGFPRRRTVPVETMPDGSAELEHEEPTRAPAARPAMRPPAGSEEKPGLRVASDRRRKGGNLLQNSAFLSWAEKGPEHWKASLPDGTSIQRAPLSADSPLKTGGILLTAEKVRPDRTISLSQRVAGGLKPMQILDLAIVGCSDTRTEVKIALIGRPSGTTVATTTITLWPKWQFRTARITVPPDFDDGDCTIVLTIRSGQAKVLNLAFVGAGAPGEDIAGEFEIRDLSTIESNAVVNGKLDHWSGHVRRPLSGRRTEITDEWSLANKSPSPGVEARLTEISPRGLRDGRNYAAVLALAVHGEVTGPYLRMEASLDALQILAGSPRQLRFFARTSGTPTVEGNVPPEGAIVQQIFIAERWRLSPEAHEFEIKRLFTIRRNIRIGRIAEMHAFDLRSDHSALLVSKAKEAIGDLGRSLLLIFEFARHVDVAIGDVCLGNDALNREVAAVPSIDDVSMEDPNIATQLPFLKGVDHWRLLQVVAPTPPLPQAASPGHVHWSWLPQSKLTVDIVMCVYNAIEETLGCLASLVQHTTIPHTITVINDKSDESTRDQLRQYVLGKPWIRLIENQSNLGYTRSANIGLSSSAAEWVVLLNSDTVVVPGWLEGLFEVVKARPNVAMVGPLSNAASWQSVPELHDIKGGWSVNPLPEGFAPADVGRLVGELSLREFPEATLLNGFCTLMRRDVVEEVGYLDEVAFPMGYGEENDLCLRIRKAGYSLAVADHVYVYHVKSASFGKARRSELSKRGTAQLLAKHPDVDMKATQREMAELTSLTELRKRLRRKLVRMEPTDVIVPGVEQKDAVNASDPATPSLVSY